MKFASCAAIAALIVLGASSRPRAQQPEVPQAALDAVGQSAAGSTIPMSVYVEPASKDGKPYFGVLVGGDPQLQGPLPVTIDAVLIPVIVEIISNEGVPTIFDPAQPDSCDGGVSNVARFRRSPIVRPSELTFNGVHVGKYQYVDGFMRAEFWNQIQGSPSYSNPLRWSFAQSAFLLPPFVGKAEGILQGKGCGQYGLVSHSLLQTYVEEFAIPLLQAAHVIAPHKLAAFLFHNLVSTDATPLTDSCCTKGFHNYVGSPAQTYAVMDFNTSTNSIFGKVRDITTASHELAEWMNDPLLLNATPAWNGSGPVTASSCSTTLEVGDPLTGTVRTVKRHGYKYHPQEMAFFSWFFNGQFAPSLGAGGVFSSAGTFSGPARPCPPGGSF
jgi:hypothetical protein